MTEREKERRMEDEKPLKTHENNRKIRKTLT